MAKIISTLFITADGVAEIDPEWHFPYFDENMGRAVGEDYDSGNVILIGRETYDSFAGAWPDRDHAGEVDATFAKQLGDARKVVVSRQALTFSWRNSELMTGTLLETATALRQDPGVTGVVIPGPLSVVQQLLAANLVDELRLLVHPVAARKGRRLFDDGDEHYHLRLTASEVFATGVIRAIYAPTDAPATAGYDDVKGEVPAWETAEECVSLTGVRAAVGNDWCMQGDRGISGICSTRSRWPVSCWSRGVCSRSWLSIA